MFFRCVLVSSTLSLSSLVCLFSSRLYVRYALLLFLVCHVVFVFVCMYVWLCFLFPRSFVPCVYAPYAYDACLFGYMFRACVTAPSCVCMCHITRMHLPFPWCRSSKAMRLLDVFTCRHCVCSYHASTCYLDVYRAIPYAWCIPYTHAACMLEHMLSRCIYHHALQEYMYAPPSMHPNGIRTW